MVPPIQRSEITFKRIADCSACLTAEVQVSPLRLRALFRISICTRPARLAKSLNDASERKNRIWRPKRLRRYQM